MMISFENGQTLDDMIAALTKLKAAMSLNARLVKKGKIYLTMKWDKVAVRLSPEDAPDCAIQELIYRDGELQVRHPEFVRSANPAWYISEPKEIKYVPVPFRMQTFTKAECQKLQRKEYERLARENMRRKYLEEELEREKRRAYYQ